MRRSKAPAIDTFASTPQGGALKWLEDAVKPYDCRVSTTQDGFDVDGDDIGKMLATRLIEQAAKDLGGIASASSTALKDTADAIIANALKYDLAFRLSGISHPVRPMSLSQSAFMHTLLTAKEPLIFGLGPTGTGKTHLAIAAGLNLLAEERIKHMILTRPHVLTEGEVVTPTIYRETELDEQFEVFDDVLQDLIGHTEAEHLIAQRKLEILPLGRLRGRTFNDAFIIVDEAQNMTIPKMRMTTTRLGRDSRMVLLGDPTQADLRGHRSGLEHLLALTQSTDFVNIFRFGDGHIVRNEFVARLETLYAHDAGGEREEQMPAN